MADRSVERVISIRKVASVMFGGPNLNVLVVTSMAKATLPRVPGDGPLRGSLFAIHDLGIPGLASYVSPRSRQAISFHPTVETIR